MNDPTQLQQKLGDLGAQFLQRTKREAETLRGLMARIQDGDSSAFQEIEYFGHRICGTGATLGFAAISDHAARIERLAEGRTAADSEVLQQLENSLSGLEQALAAALK